MCCFKCIQTLFLLPHKPVHPPQSKSQPSFSSPLDLHIAITTHPYSHQFIPFYNHPSQPNHFITIHLNLVVDEKPFPSPISTRIPLWKRKGRKGVVSYVVRHLGREITLFLYLISFAHAWCSIQNNIVKLHTTCSMKSLSEPSSFKIPFFATLFLNNYK